jgi:DNA-directed RNA polymerase specialized sigma24 family protein
LKQTPPARVPHVAASPVGFPDDTAREAFIVSAYEEHHAAIFAFLARSTRDPSLAENLLQDTYVRLPKQVHYDAAPSEVRSALFHIASNLVIEQHGRPPTSGGRFDRPSRGRVLTLDATTDIEQALEGLSVDARVALLLSSEGFTGAEIAAAIGRSIPATRSLLYLARSRVRIRRELFAAAGP